MKRVSELKSLIWILLTVLIVASPSVVRAMDLNDVFGDIEAMKHLEDATKLLEVKVDKIDNKLIRVESDVSALKEQIALLSNTLSEMSKPQSVATAKTACDCKDCQCNDCGSGPCPTPSVEKVAVVESKPIVASRPAVSPSVTSSDSYRARWTYPGNISTHLSSTHGVDVSGMSVSDQLRLHDSMHEAERGSSTVRYSVASPVRSYVRSSSCPGGVCPMPSRTTTRFRLFGR